VQQQRLKKQKKKLVADNGMEDGGYNSSDEHAVYGIGRSDKEIRLEWERARVGAEEEFKVFAKELRERKGLVIRPMGMDGNCLFRSVADQIYGDEDMHDQVRERCMDFIEAERDHFSQFITEDFEQYVARKRRDRTYGNNTEIQAIGELYNRPIEIYTFNQDGLQVEPLNLFHSQYKTDNAPIRLSYHHGNHYNSIVDPNAPSVGVGLGLPNLQPGLADQMQVKKAIQESETSELDQRFLEELTKESEIEAAEKELEEAILLESQRELEEQILQQSRQEYFQEMYKKYGMT